MPLIGLSASAGKPQSTQNTEIRKERGLLDAVRLAGPFIMSSQGKQ
jgi:hypothetical protein